MRKVCSDVLKLSVGVEDYQRNSLLEYDSYCYTLDYNILAAHADAQWRMLPGVFLNLSARTEYMSHAQWLFMPRATLSYVPNKIFQISLVAGRYSQTAMMIILPPATILLGSVLLIMLSSPCNINRRVHL